MEIKVLKATVEAILFAVGEPISVEKIAEAAGVEREAVRSVLKELASRYDNAESGICLLSFDDRYQLATRPAFSAPVTKALDNRRNTQLSNASLEVLAIIAYNQPVSRSFIEQVRGVDSSSSVSNLLNKGLIAESGRLDLPGRPVAFRTTDVFLRCFGLSSLSELPPIHSDELGYEPLAEQTELMPGLI